MSESFNIQQLSQILADPAFRASLLNWLEGLKTEEGYRLFAGGPPHLLATSFAVFLKELLLDLPAAGSLEAGRFAAQLLQQRDAESGLFCVTERDQLAASRHGLAYLELQQTHFALQALRLLGEGESVELPFLERWRERAQLRAFFDQLDWRNPWLESNQVMFLLYFFEHALWAGQPGPWEARIQDGLDWLDEKQDKDSALWGIKATSKVYNAIYGAFHFLPFYLHWRGEIPQAAKILDWTRKLQTSEGFFSHARGGGACEDYDCADLLLKLGDRQDLPRLLRCSHAVLEGRNSDGGFAWARPRQGAGAFVAANWIPALSLTENRKLMTGRVKNLLPQGQRWRYSGLANLDCAMRDSDIWSTWFRLLILAETDDHFGDSGQSWGFRSFPSLGWHVSRKGNGRD